LQRAEQVREGATGHCESSAAGKLPALLRPPDLIIILYY
jgi:hypothetical protein